MRARSAGSTRSRSARTWSTARTPTPPRRARWRCSSPSWPDRGLARVLRLILASRSPQRSAILEQLGVAFDIRVPEVEELVSGPPHEVAIENAYRKAHAIRERGVDGSVLGADTVVALGGTIYGKPADRGQARTTLEALSGRRHAVIGALC